MKRNYAKATFASTLLFVLFACQKDINEPTLTTQVEQESRVSQPSLPDKLVSLNAVSLGSSVGPRGDIFVPDGASGTIIRVDPKSGKHSTFASGLPQLLAGVGIGGVTDVAFYGGKAYALVTIVDDPTLFPTGQINGIYRIDGPASFKVIADIGAYNLAHPPTGFTFFISTGVSYSIQPFHGGFLVTDGHLNRVLYVTPGGKISVVKSFNDIVPTGLAVEGNRVYMSQAGPVPHLPENGKIVSINTKSGNVTNVASGAPLLVDVEFGRGETIYALSQGTGSGGPDGSPALPNTGSLLKVNRNGSFTILADELNQPTSMEIIGNTAYIITLNGDIWTVDNLGGHSNWPHKNHFHSGHH